MSARPLKQVIGASRTMWCACA